MTLISCEYICIHADIRPQAEVALYVTLHVAGTYTSIFDILAIKSVEMTTDLKATMVCSTIFAYN